MPEYDLCVNLNYGLGAGGTHTNRKTERHINTMTRPGLYVSVLVCATPNLINIME